MNSFTIKDLENLSGVKAHTIRIWEQRYSFLKPKRSTTNIRFYSNEELKTLLNVALLNKYGFKISHIDRMREDEISEKVLSCTNTEAQHERIVNDLIKYMIDLDLNKFEAAIDNYILPKGIEKAIMNIIFPFLSRIGILWATNHINPAQEHLTTNIIRQKLIVGIESIMIHVKKNRTFMLFLPEGEFHELGLLFMHYLLKWRGYDVLYLGSNVPLKDVVYIANLKKPEYILMHLTCVAPSFNLNKYLQRITLSIPAIPVIISGKLLKLQKLKDTNRLKFKHSLEEVIASVDSL